MKITTVSGSTSSIIAVSGKSCASSSVTVLGKTLQIT
jgi:hypothetical protein